MLLMTPEKAALAIGARCSGSAPDADNTQLREILRLLTPRVEEALNVRSLTRGVYRDHFFIPVPHPSTRRAGTPTILRLTNGFLVPNTVEIVNSSGEPVENFVAHCQQGMVHVSPNISGVHYVQYQSGFEPEEIPDDAPADFDPEYLVLLEVPDFIESIVVACLVLWYRTTVINVRASKDLSIGAVMNSLRREITTRIYGKYQRQRAGVVFGDPV